MQLATMTRMAGHRRKLPLRTLSIADDAWAAFGEAATESGRSRPDAMRDFIDWVIADPQLWRDVRQAAEDHGETMRAVVLRQLRAYLDQ